METNQSEESFADSPSKKHKKHKKRKHKKKIREDYVETFESDDDDVIAAKPIKLKIKFGSLSKKDVLISSSTAVDTEQPKSRPKREKAERTKPDKSVEKNDKEKVAEVPKTWKSKDDVFRTKRSDEDTSDEEKQWLDALEKGDLDDKGDIRKSKDLKLMTTRQRALIHGIKEEPLMQLPSGYKPADLTEEQIQKRQQKAKQRREQAARKQEKDKKQTLARLLYKQDSKHKGPTPKNKPAQDRKAKPPGFRYVSGDDISISVPEGFEFPMSTQVAKPPPEVVLCGVTGCQNPKKYSCSKTGVPLCSLNCYKLNLAATPATAATVMASQSVSSVALSLEVTCAS